MDASSFKKIYEEFSLPLYREAFLQLKEEQAAAFVVREVFEIFKLGNYTREEVSLHALPFLEERIEAYKKAKLLLDREWLCMQSEEIIGKKKPKHKRVIRQVQPAEIELPSMPEVEEVTVATSPEIEEVEQEEQPGNCFYTALAIGFALLTLLFLWMIANVCMGFEWLPFYDLGYSWFNEAVYPLFTILS